MENPSLSLAVDRLVFCFRNGGKLMVCGNGGSAADSAHIVGELVKGFLKKRPLPESWQTALGGMPLQMGLPALDLTAQGALISAISNDLGGDFVYAQQVLAYGWPDDVLLGISTSGNARNVELAMRAAHLRDVFCIGLTGRGGGRLKAVSDLLIESTESETYKVQEEHIRLYHALCARVEAAFFDI